MSEDKLYVIPNPIVDLREMKALEALEQQYEKLMKPSKIAMIGEKASALLPEKLKEVGGTAAEFISEQELFNHIIKIATESYNDLQGAAARLTISEKKIISRLNSLDRKNEITRIDEACLLRSYKIAEEIRKAKFSDMIIAALEGGSLGMLADAMPLRALAMSITLSMFLYHRAVQWIAMCYGYDVKRNPAESMLAASVFVNALSPAKSDANEMSDIIAKIMATNEMIGIKNAAGKSWSAMVSEGSIGQLLTKLRALSNIHAKKALEEAGKKGFENHVFKNLLKEIGGNLTQKNILKSAKYVGGFLGLLMDTHQMKRVLEYANIFYHIKFLGEKEQRINLLVDEPDEKDIIYIEL